MNYILWVGGIDDHFDNYDDAEFAYLERLAQGYDDAVLEIVEKVES